MLNTSGSYCDGNVPLPHSGAVELVSLTLGTVNFRDNASQLNIRSAATVGKNEVVYLLGVDKRPGKSYRLDGAMGPVGLTVDLRYAIHPIGIEAKQLGLTAWRDTNKGKEFIPLIAGASRDQISSAHAVIRTPVPLVKLVKQLCDIQVDRCDQTQLIGFQVAAGSSVDVEIPLGSVSGVFELKVSSLNATGVTNATSYRIMLPSKP
jgi:hypothetical protein